ncbi:MAG: LytR C-terminal domain-containing protein [Microgenomates group bacterium]
MVPARTPKKRPSVRKPVRRPTRVVTKSKRTKKSGTSKILQVLFMGVLGVTALVWLLYSFILPEILFWNLEEKTIVLVPSDIHSGNQLVLVARLQSDFDKSFVVPISADTSVSVINGYGEYELRSVYPLLHLSTENQPETTAVYAHIFESLIDLVIAHPQVNQDVLSSGELPRQLFWKGLKGIGSDSQWADTLRTAYALRYGQLDSIRTPTEVHAAIAAPGALDASVVQGCPVVVVNTTVVSGLARAVTDSFEENGVFVVRSISETPQREKTAILLDESSLEQCMSIADKISVFFPNPPEREVKKDLEKYYRGTIIVLLGNDTAESFAK